MIQSMPRLTSRCNSFSAGRLVLTTPLLLLVASAVVVGESAGQQVASSDADRPTASAADAGSEDWLQGQAGRGEELPWDYSPYKVLIWIVSDHPAVNASVLDEPLRTFLDIDFRSLWRVDIADAPPPVQIAAERDIDSLSYDALTASDPVIAVKRDHPEAVRIRTAANVGSIVKQVHATEGRIASIKRRGAAVDNDSVDGVADRLVAVEGDELAVRELWAEQDTEALLISRGMAVGLEEPEAKLVTPRVSGLVAENIEVYDKIFIVRVEHRSIPNVISVVEMETLMRHFGPTAVEQSIDNIGEIADAVGRGVTRAFAPVVRIEEAGQRSADGLLRGGGLIVDENSPGMVGKGDVLVPMVRKNDRNGNPYIIGRIDWAYLFVTEVERNKLKMDYHAGRPGGLQGRRNQRTFRTALKARNFGDHTLVRLHAKDDPDFPLIGYEIYQRDLDSSDMTFVGRTDWNGRLLVEKTDDPLRLLYVKNGGAVLARLPTVPGLTDKEVADISGDDMRLQAEAFIRGVQNTIIDLVAVRELFKARIELRLKKGTPEDMEKAKDLLVALRSQPTNERIAAELSKKQDTFIKAIGRNANQRRKVDEMFTTTRDLLTKHINPQLIKELDVKVAAAEANGGKLPEEEPAEEAPAESGQE